MARLLRLVCPEYEFTDEELVLAATLTEVQKQFIQTQIALLSAEKNTISYSPDEGDAANRYIIEHEFNRGRILSFQYLLDCHDSAQEQLKFMHSRQAGLQQRDDG